MPPFRYFRGSAASGRGEMRVLVIAGELIYANVRLRLAVNLTYGFCYFHFPSFLAHILQTGAFERARLE